MRPPPEWRKVYGKKVIESDRLASLSFDARWLWLLYTVAQDDEGKYPFTRVKVLSLAVGTEWKWDDCQRLTKDLITSGLLTEDGDFVYVVNGAEYNGHMRSDREGFVFPTPLPSVVYQRYTGGMSVDAVNASSPSLSSLISSVSSLGEGIVKGRGKVEPITPEFEALMVAEYGAGLGGESGVKQRIEEAMNHKAGDKAKNKEIYVRGWLRRDAEKLNGGRNGKDDGVRSGSTPRGGRLGL